VDRLACASAILNLVAVPAIYAGINASGFYTADGLVSLTSELPFLIWALAASISMIVGKQEARAKTPAYGG